MVGFYASADILRYNGRDSRAAGAPRRLPAHRLVIETVTENGNSRRTIDQVLAHACRSGDVTRGKMLRGRAKKNFVSRADLEVQEAGRCNSMPRAKVLVLRVESLVLELLPERLNEDFFACSLGVEIRELHAAFFKVRGTGLYAALRTLRITEVKRRFDADEDLSIDRAGGFASYAWFRQEYLQRFGVDPKRLRQSPRIVGRPAKCKKISISEPGECGASYSKK
jgi:AraC-like DNA-binding protein